MIKWFEFTSIEAERFAKHGEVIKNVRIDHNSTITSISKVNESDVEVHYRFTINYGGFGIIKIEGMIVYQGDADNVYQTWRKSGQLPDDVATEIHTTIINNCIPEAMMLSRDLRLPPPLPLPKVEFKRGKKAVFGPEVA
ncbi:MAG: hypothetical protein DRN20_02540 [Thermoplasmata archaeon]|nr:MAG: hypothetical protein DRN20_02540 [Thermoplasmata archaeon]